MSQKKLMLLGGLRYLLPAIKAAHEQGYYVITADYLPNNIAHKYSDEYVNVSIIDKEAVLKVAKEKQIDGIMSYAVDPGVVTASYVQKEMSLPAFGPYESVDILQHKDKFRAFLAKNGFNVPQAKGFDSIEAAMEEIDWYPWPVIVKPTDSAGSKGVTKVEKVEELKPALEWAMENSLSGHIIVEEFIDKLGCSSDCDCFSLNGELKVCVFNAQHFDLNAAGPYVPAAYSWPSTFGDENEAILRSEIQRLLTLLNMQTCLYNVETRIGTNGKPYIMECTPRAGGNRLAEMIRFGTGTDMITASVRGCVGDSVKIEQKPFDGHWAEIILHANKSGIFDSLEISSDFPGEVVERDLWVSKGDHVDSFIGANNSIGTLVIRFETQEVLKENLSNQNWWKVIVK
jgi:carbamoylphosphate synthase large subunit